MFLLITVSSASNSLLIPKWALWLLLGVAAALLFVRENICRRLARDFPHLTDSVRLRAAITQWINLHRARFIVFLVVLGLSLYLISLRDIAFLHWLGLIFPVERRGTRHLVNLFGIVGLVITIGGVWATFIQLELDNTRIEQYRSFYRWVDQLFAEMDKMQEAEFHFFGSTILPGNVANINDLRPVEAFQQKLVKLYNNIDYKNVKQAIVITPNDRGYMAAYEFYDRYKMARATKEQKKNWVNTVNGARISALALQHKLVSSGKETSGRTVVTVSPADSENFSWLQKAYFLSNGQRAIYAVPLHYLSPSHEDEGAHEINPNLIGMTTTNPGIIEALEQTFASLLIPARDVSILRADLKSMYEKHPVKPAWVYSKISCDIAAKVPKIDALEPAQDHFLGREAIDYGISKMKPVCENSCVLDAGSGMGGLALYVQLQYHCQTVVGIEIQEDRRLCAEKIGTAVGASVGFVDRDILSYLTEDSHRAKFTHVFSLLTILHCPHKREILEAIGGAMLPDGSLYIEDYVVARTPTADELGRLKSVISCPGLLSLSEYIRCLELGGTKICEIEDVTELWKSIAIERENEFSAEPPQSPLLQQLTSEGIEKARSFAKGVAALFKDGVISGVRISGRKIE
jgi:SAM-dependent methyltransferase